MCFEKKKDTDSKPFRSISSTIEHHLTGWRLREHPRWANMGRVNPEHPLLWIQARMNHVTVS